MRTFLVLLLVVSTTILISCMSKDKAEYDDTIPPEEDRNTEMNTNQGMDQGGPGTTDRTKEPNPSDTTM